MTNFFVLRHGDISNPDQILYLRMDKEIKLSPLGESQVTAQSKKLKLHHIKAIYFSPLYRTRQSAYLAEKVLRTQCLIPDDRLLDVANPMQGLSLAKFDRQWDGNLYHPDLIAKGGETIAQVANRMKTVVNDLASRYSKQSVLLVSHGDPIKILWLIANHQKLNKKSIGSDRVPTLGNPYPDKGSVTVFKYQKRLTKVSYWPPPEIG